MHDAPAAAAAVNEKGGPPLNPPPIALRYRIKEMLDSMPAVQNKVAMKELPSILGIARQTWLNYRQLAVTSTGDIPGTHLMLIARYFNCDVQDLFTPAAIDAMAAQEGGAE